ncbi:GGDEF domain-containing protein [Schlegelella sp. S2-27]|uniref:diguanylate cyclase n=1 Tax=Caldimonas mangrovi TaxID=2944811 RepID=A0ABT0YIR4_9BURK|nr:GGDEF domain-containing protein [Caldimonas mangrovi]MCM5678608.1 GGDEF domain-containing protein [Caldimonas mangrovi]
MSDPVESLAALTIHRDLDALDSALVHSLAELLQPTAIAIHRVVGLHQTSSRWSVSARLGRLVTFGRPAERATLDDELSPLHALPAHQTCLETATVRSFDAASSGVGLDMTLFPLGSTGGPVAVLEIQSHRPLEPHEMQTVASILRVFQNFWNVLDESERDTLTGLLNRKTFDDAFFKTAHALPGTASAAPGATGCWIAVFDIDHFKSVNDRFGHLIGDEVLLLVARMLREMFRHHDRLYRFGGEEFVVLLRCDSEADASRALERVRERMAHHPFPQVGRVTVSIGFAQVLPGDTPSTAFGRADKAVYHAKQTGRNRVCSHADLVTQGHACEQESAVGEVELF